MTEVKGPGPIQLPPPKCQVRMFAPMRCAFKMPPELHNMQRYARWAQATQCAALHKMQPKLHNSANRGFSKFVYLSHCLVVCFYPQPPAWPWSWCHTYHQMASVSVCGVGAVDFEVSSDTSISNVVDPGIRATRISSFEGALFSWGQELMIRFGTIKQYRFLRLMIEELENRW